nr:sorting nexin-20 isoform X1 [Pogona vitticeps]
MSFLLCWSFKKREKFVKSASLSKAKPIAAVILSKKKPRTQTRSRDLNSVTTKTIARILRELQWKESSSPREKANKNLVLYLSLWLWLLPARMKMTSTKTQLCFKKIRNRLKAQLTQMYQIIIVQTGSFDSNRSVIERRYSDFERLHTNLLKEFYDEMEDVLFPKKSLTGNFTDDIILERKLAFQDYLRLLYSMEYIRTSRIFIDFLVRAELEEGYSCLRGGQYAKALQVFLDVVVLQEKLTKHRPILVVPTLCAILVCHKDLEDARSAYEFGEKALMRLEKHPSHRYYMPLLETMLSLAYELGKDFVSFQDKIDERKARKRQNKMVTLKELAVLEYIH